MFLDDVVWSEASDFRELLQANWVYLNGRLAQLYRPDLPVDAPFMKMEFDPAERAALTDALAEVFYGLPAFQEFQREY